MSDSSSDEDNDTYVMFKDRPDWKDVVPIEQDDEDEIVAINYSEKFRDAHDYLRGVLKTGEKSDRVLELTQVVLNENPANYSVWQFRRDLLKHLNKDLTDELDYMEKFIMRKSKNYQVWHHRRLLVETLKDPSREKAFTCRILSKDAKNYHAWQYRQWIVKHFNLYEGELDYVETLLDDDIRNNSAWNHRYFVVSNTSGFGKDVLDYELQYTFARIGQLTENESAWNYLQGILIHDENGFENNQLLKTFCEELYVNKNRSSFLLHLMMDICFQSKSDPMYTLDLGLKLKTKLSMSVDKTRAKYYEHLADTRLKAEENAAGDAQL